MTEFGNCFSWDSGNSKSGLDPSKWEIPIGIPGIVPEIPSEKLLGKKKVGKREKNSINWEKENPGSSSGDQGRELGID